MVKYVKFTGGDFIIEPKKHKRKIKRYLIYTSDATEHVDRQIRIYPSVCTGVGILFLCVIIIAFLAISQNGLFLNISLPNQKEQKIQIQDLEEKNKALEEEVKNLSSNVLALSETLQQKIDSETKLQAELTDLSLPTDFPLNRAASITESTEGDPMCIFAASEGSFVIAAATGTVIAVEDNEEYGHSISIDHGNGYVTIYKNKGEAQVKVGDEVLKGMTLYIVSEENTSLGYQMLFQGNYINPMEMLSIRG